MELVDIVVLVVVGGLVGWLAGHIMKTSGQMGVISNVVVGILGSGLGWWAFTVLGLSAYGLVAHLIMQVLGAVLLIAILKGFKIYR
jgi:uncharacterized membrane protein YeaQ/YmgE (transglycosylase-associated protein family)